MIELPAPLLSRPARDADHPFFDTLYRSIRTDLVGALADEAMLAHMLRMQQDADTLGRHQHFPEAQVFLLEREGQPIGRLVIEAARGRLHLLELSLLPRSRHHGYGSCILRALKALAARRGEPMTLHVALHNTGAALLYARHGFTVVADDGVQQHMLWMHDGQSDGRGDMA